MGAAMTRYAVVLLASVLALYDTHIRTGNPLKSEHIHWSNQSTLRSPDRKWVLTVQPSHSNDDSANVYISRVGGKARSLFHLQRDAEIYWRSNYNQLVILDEKSSNDYRLMVFNLKEPSERAALTLNEAVHREITEQLKSGDQIAYYFPRFSGWIDNGDLLVAVGVVTVHDGSGAFTAHCFGYIANGDSLAIKSRPSESDLKEKYGVTCQIWP
jgi:hypothetical protein